MHPRLADLVDDELNALYQGALFLCTGDEDAAEELLWDTVGRARYAAMRAGGQDPRRWLSGLLAREYLARPPRYRVERPAPAGTDPRSDPSRSDQPERELNRVFEAVDRTPHAARPALWLVMIRRWPYGEVARALGVELGELHELLRYRGEFLFALAGDTWRDSSGGRGTGSGD